MWAARSGPEAVACAPAAVCRLGPRGPGVEGEIHTRDPYARREGAGCRVTCGARLLVDLVVRARHHGGWVVGVHGDRRLVLLVLGEGCRRALIGDQGVRGGRSLR